MLVRYPLSASGDGAVTAGTLVYPYPLFAK